MIVVLIVVLFVLMAAVGGDRGAKSFITLVINTAIGAACIFLVTEGLHPLAGLLISSLLFCFVTIAYQNDINEKSVASLISIAAVIFISTFLIYYVCANAHISGFSEAERKNEEMRYLGSGVNFKMRYLYLTAMIWCQIGAISDTSMAISTSVNEISIHNPEFTWRQLFREGMIIGRDILGTTINTLFFVALGEAAMLFMYYRTYGYSFAKIINASSFSQTILPVMIPCIGCIIIIPLTSLVFSLIKKRGTIHEQKLCK